MLLVYVMQKRMSWNQSSEK